MGITSRLVAKGPGAPPIDVVIDRATRMGAAADNEICLAGVGVGRHHAKVVAIDDGGVALESTDTQPVYVNGERVQRVRLRHLDVVTLAPRIDLVYLERAGEVPTPAPSAGIERVTLTWMEGARRDTKIDVSRGELLIGRAPVCGIIVDLPPISRVHARLSHTGDLLTIQDLTSVNGTFVDGRRIDQRTVLESGNVVALGGVPLFRVAIEREGHGRTSGSVRPTNSGQATLIASVAVDQEWRARLEDSPQEALDRAGAEAGVADATVLAQQPVPMPVELGADDPTVPPSAGEGTVLAREPVAMPPVLGSDQSRIVGLTLSDSRGSRTLPLGRSTVGRAMDAAVCIEKPYISRLHAIFVVTPSEVAIEDQGSENGTEVNRERISGRRVLASGDRVAFAGEEFQIEIVRTGGAS